jgi:hypothetical protein
MSIRIAPANLNLDHSLNISKTKVQIRTSLAAVSIASVYLTRQHFPVWQSDGNSGANGRTATNVDRRLALANKRLV